MTKTYEKVDGKLRMTKEYSQWFDMIQRCTSDRVKATHPNYTETDITEDWLDFSTWLTWAKAQTGFQKKDYEGKYFQIDKDLLGTGNYYSPETCVFLPAEINKALIVSCKGFQQLPNGKYRAVGFCNGKRKSLGCHITQEEAGAALSKYRKEVLLKVVERYKPILDPDVYMELINYDFAEPIRSTF